MIKILIVCAISLIIFGLFALSLVFSRYRRRDRGIESSHSDHNSPHRCGHCVCDLDRK